MKKVKTIVIRILMDVAGINRAGMVLLLICVVLAVPLRAQVKTSVKYSADIEYKIQRAKQIEQQVRQYRKDSSRVAKEQLKQIKNSTDSLVRALKKEARSEGLKRLNETTDLMSARQQQALAVVNQQLANKDKYTKINKQEMRNMLMQNVEQRPEFAQYSSMLDQELGQYRTQFTQYKALIKDGADSLQAQHQKIDSLEVWKELEELAISEAMKTSYYEAFMKEQGSLAALGKDPQATFMNDVPTFDFDNHPLKTARQAGMKHFENINQSIQQSAPQLDQLKKKYATVLDSKDLTTATKRNSLSGVPMGKRLVYGGNFQLNIGDPLSMDFNPILGYRLDKKWTVGIGGTIRFNLSHNDTTGLQYRVPVTGLRGFGEYRFYKSFLTHAEYEALADNVFSSEQPNRIEHPSQSINIGLGNTFGIYKGLKGKVLLLYNFTLDGERLYNSPWVVRFGLLR